MAVYHNNPGLGVLVAVATSQYLLVKDDGTLCAADATNDVLGVSTNNALANQNLPVRFRTAGTWVCTSAGAIAAGALVYKAASGQVGTTDTNLLIGRALSATSAADQEIEVLPTF